MGEVSLSCDPDGRCLRLIRSASQPESFSLFLDALNAPSLPMPQPTCFNLILVNHLDKALTIIKGECFAVGCLGLARQLFLVGQ